jgi:hypothetical protein
MSLAVASYPKLTDNDYKDVQHFRKEHDRLYYSVTQPHFSFVFPLEGIEKGRFIDEVYKKSNGCGKIQFEIRCATVNKDAVIQYYHLLLVPDEGYSRMVKLHDRLYSGLFFEHLRLDIDFIPHMGIANSKDP